MSKHIRAGEAAVRILERQGVKYAFGVPGESFLGLLDVLRDSDQIQLIGTRHEGGAAFMAEAVGKLTGAPAIAMGTRGVGSANLTIGIHTAYQDSTPMIAMVGHVETPYRHREALQEVELAPFLSEITKWAIEVPTGDRLPDLTNEAWRRSVSGRPGPVALALRGDILDEEVPADLPISSEVPIAGADRAGIERALDLLRAAERPLVIVGGGVLRAGATDALVAFAEATGLPVMTSFRRHDAFPNDHPLSIGSLSLGAPNVVVERARNADVVLAIGTRLGETTTFGYTLPGPDATLIHIDASPDVVGRTFPATVALVADAGRAIAALTEAAAKTDWPDWSARNRAARDAYERATEPPAVSGVQDLVDPARVIGELNRQLPPDAVLTCDAGNFYGWLSRYYTYRQPGTFLGPTSGAMGYAVPAAVAAALVLENRVPSVAFAGDGGFMMTSNELAVAAQHGLRVTCVVFNNSMYGTIRAHQERAYPGRVAGTNLASPDFVKYAESFGGIGVRVERDQDIADGVRQVVEHDGIGLLEIAVAENTLSVAQTLEEIRGSR